MKRTRTVTRDRATRLSVESLESRTLLAAGQLDPTFDGDGVLFANSLGAFTAAGTARVQAAEFAGGGKVVVAGFAGADRSDPNFVPAAARLNPDGTPDPTFSGDGWAALTPNGETAGGEATAVAIQADQKVIIGMTNPLNRRIGLARFNADGSLDTAFAGDGIWEFPDPTMSDVAVIEVLPDGKILAAGGMDYTWVGRFNANGTLDTTFGLGGLVSVDPTPAAGIRDRPKALTVDPAGRVVVGGGARWQSSDERPFIARLNTAGRIDSTFGGGDGIVELDPVAIPRGEVLAVRAEADNGITAAGSFNPGFFLARVLPDSTPDETFGPAGRRVSNDAQFAAPPTLSLRAMEFLPDGRVVAAGPLGTQPGPYDNIIVRRYLPDATPDPTFGTGGEARTPLGGQLVSVPDVAVTPAGDVAVPVFLPTATGNQSAIVARYTPDGHLDPAFGGGGVTAQYRVPVLVDLTDSSETLDGKIVSFGTFRGMRLVVRFNRDGTLDNSFDGDGWTVVPVGSDLVTESLVLPDGRMLVADRHGNLVRLNPDATPDTTFGTGGVVSTTMIVDFALQPDGRVVVLSQGSNRFETRRYNSDGIPDTTFGNGGVVITSPSNGENTAAAVTVLSDGGIVVGGTASDSAPPGFRGWALVRYRPDGTPDTDFGNQFNRPGVALIAPPQQSGGLGDLLALPGAAFYASGTFDSDYALARFRPDGSLDPAFSGDGLAYAGVPTAGLTPYAPPSLDREADGKIIVAGATTAGFMRFTAVRFNPDGTVDPNYGNGGRGSVDTGTVTGPDVLVMSDGGVLFTESTGLLVRLRGDSGGPLAPAARDVFYNNSAFDGADARTTPADLAAVAPDKAALRPGQTASFANVTSYSRGINGVMVELNGVPPGELLPGDFVFRAGTTGDPSTWADAPPPTWLHLVPSIGGERAVRYAITWADGAIRNTWLQVTVKANARTGLASPDVFYFGNLIGETGNAPNALVVNAIDLSAVRARQLQAADVSSAFDFNRDGRINAVDLGLCRANQLQSLPAIQPAGVPEVGQRTTYGAAQAVGFPGTLRKTRQLS